MDLPPLFIGDKMITDFGRNSFVTWPIGLVERIRRARMREIKFRAWDGKKMQYDVFPTSDNTVGRWIETGGGVELRFCDGGGTKVDIMQFTGLKDKNGKEIYEGDVVKLDTPQNPYHPTRNKTIIFNLQFAQFCVEPCTSIRGWKSVEVIGNIHQHPELIEDKK
jgi:hypothetical protein